MAYNVALMTLFGQDMPAGTEADPADAPVGPFAAVALEYSIDRMLDYSIPEKIIPALQVGQRVRVPLGKNNRAAYGYVVRIHDTTEYRRIKPLFNIDDDRVLIQENLMALARWMSRYYVAPLGSVLETIIPSAVKKKIGLGYMQVVRLVADREKVQELIEKIRAPKRRAILARLLQLQEGEGIELHRLAGEAGATTGTIRKLAGVLSITSEVDLSAMLPVEDNGTPTQAAPPVLNADQQGALDAMTPRLRDGIFSINLLHGVTGSGKTEVYLRCIEQVVSRGQQAIVLVPEIALTPQTVRRFTARFPRVAVLHSGLTAGQRHRYWQQISSGYAQVVVGARSAIFAPMKDVGVIVVDEEHEPSYKQDQLPRYSARDVAIKRGQLEKVPVILGSATPSLEMYWQATRPPSDDGKSSRYHLLRLPNRAASAAMPRVELVNMQLERKMRKGVHLISTRLEKLLRDTLAADQQAILLLNRRGYSNFVHCPSCQHLVQCKYCDTTMTYHRSSGTQAHGASHAQGLHTGQMHCHYCLAVSPLPSACPECGKKLSLFGLGTQRVEEELTHKFPGLEYARVDSDTMRSSKDYEAMLGRFGRGELKVMLGTQMIAKGLDYPNVTLVGVISGDTALSIPDFRSSERTFQLITQVAGRAGRGDKPGRVAVQTFLPDDPTIQAALAHDYEAFAKRELAQRREVGYPPFSRLARIIIREQEENKLQELSDAIAARLAAALPEVENAARVQIKGPMPCAVSRIAGYFRNQIVLMSNDAVALQRVLGRMRTKGDLARTDRVAVDVDPVNLL